ncbi:hypothetical protein COCNU_06G010920 [Cocos nucifera]|uniref:J domain-containing protein n=1 Tax=Cocos nucifera TaxID=13894 RepID=A0A8K0IBG2_COCNU|nr:hypothetical protein COCNU_06G010920 [Cocos nucifera]
MNPMEFDGKAQQAKDRAEQNFRDENIEGAIRSALEAKSLDPTLPGLPQMLAAFCVHLAAAKKLDDNSTDWHAVLGVEPSADGETIKKQYRKLCILVHPDKNPSAAADGAFKLITEACKKLSDNHLSPDATEPSSQPEQSRCDCRMFCRQCRTSFQASMRPKTSNVECVHCGASIKVWTSLFKDTEGSTELLTLKPDGGSGGARLRPCPRTCPHCGTWYSSTVEAGRCILRCRRPSSLLLESTIDDGHSSDAEPDEDDVEQVAEEFVRKFEHTKFGRMDRRRTLTKI